jgi:hypothetical protein
MALSRHLAPVLVLLAACSRTAEDGRFQIVEQSGKTLRMDRQTGETMVLVDGTWRPLPVATAPEEPTPSPTPKGPQPLPASDAFMVRIGAAGDRRPAPTNVLNGNPRAEEWAATFRIINESKWDLRRLRVTVQTDLEPVDLILIDGSERPLLSGETKTVTKGLGRLTTEEIGDWTWRMRELEGEPAKEPMPGGAGRPILLPAEVAAGIKAGTRKNKQGHTILVIENTTQWEIHDIEVVVNDVARRLLTTRPVFGDPTPPLAAGKVAQFVINESGELFDWKVKFVTGIPPRTAPVQ